MLYVDFIGSYGVVQPRLHGEYASLLRASMSNAGSAPRKRGVLDSRLTRPRGVGFSPA